MKWAALGATVGDWETGDLVGATLVSARTVSIDSDDESEDRLVFETAHGDVWQWYHARDCCEVVWIEDVCGHLDDLVGQPILLAEEVISTKSRDAPGWRRQSGDRERGEPGDTWTFYKFATIKGSVTVRWMGESNGYYSERVSLRVERCDRVALQARADWATE